MESYRDYVCTMADRILKGEVSEREGCRLLAAAHGGDLARGEVQAFWLLDMAVRENEAEGFQSYDQRFGGHNFEEIVRIEAAHLGENLGRRPKDAV